MAVLQRITVSTLLVLLVALGVTTDAQANVAGFVGCGGLVGNVDAQNGCRIVAHQDIALDAVRLQFFVDVPDETAKPTSVYFPVYKKSFAEYDLRNTSAEPVTLIIGFPMKNAWPTETDGEAREGHASSRQSEGLAAAAKSEPIPGESIPASIAAYTVDGHDADWTLFRVDASVDEHPGHASTLASAKKYAYDTVALSELSFEPGQSRTLRYVFAAGVGSHQLGFYWLSYILRSGTTWKDGRIGQLDLRVEFGEPLTYCMLSSLEGMSFDPQSKLATWSATQYQPKQDLRLHYYPRRAYLYDLNHDILADRYLDAVVDPHQFDEDPLEITSTELIEKGRWFDPDELAFSYRDPRSKLALPRHVDDCRRYGVSDSDPESSGIVQDYYLVEPQAGPGIDAEPLGPYEAQFVRMIELEQQRRLAPRFRSPCPAHAQCPKSYDVLFPLLDLLCNDRWETAAEETLAQSLDAKHFAVDDLPFLFNAVGAMSEYPFKNEALSSFFYGPAVGGALNAEWLPDSCRAAIAAPRPANELPKTLRRAQERIKATYDERRKLSEAFDMFGEYVQLGAAEFVMGQSAPSQLWSSNHEPTRTVRSTRPFTMKRSEVNRAEFRALMGFDPSRDIACGPTCPVENVSFDDALRYCNAASRAAGYTPCYTLISDSGEDDEEYDEGHGFAFSARQSQWTFSGLDCDGYRLPTSAEWEYAARAGSRDEPSLEQLEATSWMLENSDGRVHPVEHKQANAFGLHDMLGNVWEWVWDQRFDAAVEYGKFFLDPYAEPDPRAPMLRGGAWSSHPAFVRFDVLGSSDERNGVIGFRPVRTLP